MQDGPLWIPTIAPATRIFGYPASKLIGQPPTQRICAGFVRDVSERERGRRKRYERAQFEFDDWTIPSQVYIMTATGEPGLINRRIMEYNGRNGRLRPTPGEGLGATFVFTFPVHSKAPE